MFFYGPLHMDELVLANQQEQYLTKICNNLITKMNEKIESFIKYIAHIHY